jgi:hypothetical protein
MKRVLIKTKTHGKYPKLLKCHLER